MLTDPNFYLTVLGLALAILGIYLTIRHKYPGRLTYVREASVAVFNDIVRSMPELAVTYDGAPLAANVVILRGYIVNTGGKDFTSVMVAQPLTFRLPDSFRWRKALITGVSQGVTATCKLANERDIEFDLNLFRCKEHLRFEAVAEVPITDKTDKSPATRLNDALSISHRIADTLDVQTRTLPSDALEKKLWKRPGVSQFLVYLVLFAILLPIINHFTPKPAKYEFMVTRNGSSFRADVTPRADGAVKIENLDTKGTEIVSGKDFFSDRSWTAKAVPKPKKWWDYLMAAFLLMLTGFLAVNDILEHSSTCRLYRLLKS